MACICQLVKLFYDVLCKIEHMNNNDHTLVFPQLATRKYNW